MPCHHLACLFAHFYFREAQALHVKQEVSIQPLSIKQASKRRFSQPSVYNLLSSFNFMVHKLPLALISPVCVCVCQCVLCVMRRGSVFCLPRGCHCIVGISGEFSNVMNRLIWETSSLAPHPFKSITPAGKHVWNSFSSWAGLRSEREIISEEESPFGQKEKPTWKTGADMTS